MKIEIKAIINTDHGRKRSIVAFLDGIELKVPSNIEYGWIDSPDRRCIHSGFILNPRQCQFRPGDYMGYEKDEITRDDVINIIKDFNQI